VGNGLVTPTMKVKRAAIEKRYGDRFKGWYAQNQPVVWEAA
jgi:long-subunit acyl-CoA synthetase (AMP-forming)